jgi:hypothetical protein
LPAADQPPANHAIQFCINPSRRPERRSAPTSRFKSAIFKYRASPGAAARTSVRPIHFRINGLLILNESTAMIRSVVKNDGGSS